MIGNSSASNSLTATQLRQRTRILKDHLARHAVTIGGIGVIIAVVLIFFYLLSVVLPLFKSAEFEPVASYRLSAAGTDDQTLHLAMEEQAEIGVRFTRRHHHQFRQRSTRKRHRGLWTLQRNRHSGKASLSGQFSQRQAGDHPETGLPPGRGPPHRRRQGPPPSSAGGTER